MLAGDFPLLAFTGTGAFNNVGVFTKSAGDAVANINNQTYNNSGVVNADAGELQLINSTGTHTGGFNIAAGAKLTFVLDTESDQWTHRAEFWCCDP